MTIHKRERRPFTTEQANTDVASLMGDQRYLRQSAALINDALQKGFDVLQMPNGDVVTTGTKVVVSTYSWDEKRGRLVKSRSRRTRRRVTGLPDSQVSYVEELEELEDEEV
jgi:hypothetical protein